jgi:hypothetical protein
MMATAIDKRALIEEKVKCLLDNKDLKDDERNLTVLVLLARTHHEHGSATNKNVNDVDSNGATSTTSMATLFPLHLFNFCIRLVNTNQESFIRLVSLVVSSCLDRRRPSNSYNWHALTQALLGAIRHRSSNLMRDNKTDADILNCLLHCMICSKSTDTSSISMCTEDFEIIWERFRPHLNQPVEDSAADTKALPVVVDPYWRFMEDTIRSSHNDDKQDQLSPENAWKLPFVNLWHKHASDEIKLPSWYESMVMIVVSSKWDLPNETRIASQEMVFQITKSIAMVINSPLDFNNSSVAQGLADLITAHVGSSQSDLRLEAIETCSVLVSNHGWSWIPSHDNRKLGQASALCTWTRLAAGEFRIQLEIACDDESTLSFQESALEASGRIIVAAMGALAQEARNVDEGLDLTIDPEALMHLRQSFFSTLQATVSYFELVSIPRVAPSRVLGSLLSEFSVWDDDMPDGVTDEVVLHAIEKAMGTGAIEMLPCLVNLLASAQEDAAKETSIRETGILGNNLADYFTNFWGDGAFVHKDYVALACSAVESWFSLASPAAKKTRPLAKQIIQWIKTTISESGISDSTATALMSAVGCYVVLMGDRMPPDHEAKVIESVLSCYAKANDFT